MFSFCSHDAWIFADLHREVANPNLHDIRGNLRVRVEIWDPTDQHIWWVIAASASVAIGNAALDALIANYPISTLRYAGDNESHTRSAGTGSSISTNAAQSIHNQTLVSSPNLSVRRRVHMICQHTDNPRDEA
jgi:hypothetical protein